MAEDQPMRLPKQDNPDGRGKVGYQEGDGDQPVEVYDPAKEKAAAQKAAREASEETKARKSPPENK